MNQEYNYQMNLRPLSNDEGGGWLVTFPDLPGCMSDGETPHEALSNGLDAMNCWIETALEFGRKLPTL